MVKVTERLYVNDTDDKENLFFYHVEDTVYISIK